MSSHPETRLGNLLDRLEPELDPEEFVYCSLPRAEADQFLEKAICRFSEAEGDTIILRRKDAEARHLAFTFPCRRITLRVHSSLEAVGLLASVAGELARHGIGVNCVSAYFHDHLFVPAEQGEQALAVLKALQRRASGVSLQSGASPGSLPADAVIREMTISDYDAIRALLSSVPGVTLRSADSREKTQRYLERNPGLSFVAVAGARIVGCVMCGHDGRRGYLQHLAADPTLRRRGIGAALVERSLAALERLGIEKAHIDVLADNTEAQQFWVNRGWRRRSDLLRFSFSRSSEPNA